MKTKFLKDISILLRVIIMILLILIEVIIFFNINRNDILIMDIAVLIFFVIDAGIYFKMKSDFDDITGGDDNES